jgi:hypothetical protein
VVNLAALVAVVTESVDLVLTKTKVVVLQVKATLVAVAV